MCGNERDFPMHLATMAMAWQHFHIAANDHGSSTERCLVAVFEQGAVQLNTAIDAGALNSYAAAGLEA